MSGRYVIIRGSRRYWLVLEDNGETLLIEWQGIRRGADRQDIIAWLDAEQGWVPAEEVSASWEEVSAS